MCGECGNKTFKLLIKAGSYDVPEEVLAVCSRCGAGFYMHATKPSVRMRHLDFGEMSQKIIEVSNE